MRRQAAFISQKCTVEYCRARSGLNWDKLFVEPTFLEAMDLCRWEAYAAVLIDVAVMVEGKLRPFLGSIPAPALAESLTAMVGQCLAAHGVPAHRPEGWQPVVDEAARRLAQAQLAAPSAAHRIGLAAGDRVFEVLPIHPVLRGNDHELIQNNVRFNLVRAAEDFETWTDPAAIVADLLGAAPIAQT